MIRTVLATGAVGAGACLLLAGPALAASPTPSPSAASPSATSTPSVVTPSVAPPTSLLSAVPAPVETTEPGGISVPAGNAISTEQHGATATDIAALLAAGVALAGGGTVLALRRRS